VIVFNTKNKGHQCSTYRTYLTTLDSRVCKGLSRVNRAELSVEINLPGLINVFRSMFPQPESCTLSPRFWYYAGPH